MTRVTYPPGSTMATRAAHNEWLVDEAIDDSFPASDPVASGQPGSIVNMRYAAQERRARRLGAATTEKPWILVAAAFAACATALVLARRR